MSFVIQSLFMIYGYPLFQQILLFCDWPYLENKRISELLTKKDLIENVHNVVYKSRANSANLRLHIIQPASNPMINGVFISYTVVIVKLRLELLRVAL